MSESPANVEARLVDWQWLTIDKAARVCQKLQKPVCIWLTGLSGAGKSTIATLAEKRLFAAGRHAYVLDGDSIRFGLSRDLGFSEADRRENIRRVTEVARLMVDAGLIVIVAFISPYRDGNLLAEYGRLEEARESGVAPSRPAMRSCFKPWKLPLRCPARRRHNACMRPESNPRAVRTPSKWQARQPIYRSSVARWRRYESWLGPLRALVDDREGTTPGIV